MKTTFILFLFALTFQSFAQLSKTEIPENNKAIAKKAQIKEYQIIW